jgi:hypothetical protein
MPRETAKVLLRSDDDFLPSAGQCTCPRGHGHGHELCSLRYLTAQVSIEEQQWLCSLA